jgi:aspartyl-tRNA(Asn)/glutamyl-tRNA(Gln) amidotransferase subunit A
MGAAGPMCRDAADTRLLGEAIFRRELPAGDGSALRAAFVRAPFWDDIDPEVDAACHEALEAAGWSLAEIELDGSRHAPVASVLRLTIEGLPGIGEEELAEADPLTRALVKYETLLSADLLVRADRIRAQLRRGGAAAFEDYDLLVWPTVPAPSPPIENPTVTLPSGDMPADPANVRHTGFGNLTGLPGINVPVGIHSSGLPMGLQLQAAWDSEPLLLDAAEHLERATGRRHVDAVPPIAAPAAA